MWQSESAHASAQKSAYQLLHFENVSKRMNAVEIVENVDLSVERGDFVAFIGPSGCGKTTLLNMAAGLTDANQGCVFYDGKPLKGPNTKVGYLTQDDALLPWRDVLSNVALPLEVKGIKKSERIEAARAILQKVGLSGFEKYKPAQLSGGMRKRVNLARTLIYKPETMLLDEPFGALDAQTRIVMHRLLLSLCKELKLTILLVTHDISEAIALADKVVLFTARPARLCEIVKINHPEERDLFRISDENEGVFSHIWEHLAAQSKDEGPAR